MEMDTSTRVFNVAQLGQRDRSGRWGKGFHSWSETQGKQILNEPEKP
jgi:hypothetical protein